MDHFLTIPSMDESSEGEVSEGLHSRSSQLPPQVPGGIGSRASLPSPSPSYSFHPLLHPPVVASVLGPGATAVGRISSGTCQAPCSPFLENKTIRMTSRCTCKGGTAPFREAGMEWRPSGGSRKPSEKMTLYCVKRNTFNHECNRRETEAQQKHEANQRTLWCS